MFFQNLLRKNMKPIESSKAEHQKPSLPFRQSECKKKQNKTKPINNALWWKMSIKKFTRNQSYVDKPWITKGIESACIKDDAL